MNRSSARIRVGVLLDSLEVPAWQFAILESIVGSDCADLVVIALSGGVAPAHCMVHRAFLRIEDRNRRPQPDACARVSVEPLVRSIDCIGINNREAPPFIQARDLDVLIVLGNPMGLPDGVSLARYGHWHFACDGHPFEPPDGSMVGFSALLRREPSFFSSIQVHKPGDPLMRTAYSTRSAIDYYSHYLTRNEHLWKCSAFVLRVLRKCQAAGGAAFLHSLPPAPTSRGHPESSAAIMFASASIWINFLEYFIWRVWRKLCHRQVVERWVLMFGVDEIRPDAGGFKKILPPIGRFWADPHVIYTDGRHHVFFEDASRESGIGHIAVMSDNGTGTFTQPRAILQTPYHLSYPFVFQWRDDWYLLPESAANRTVELYRCIRFPHEWTFQHNLLEGVEAYDSTLVEHEGRWWLFANLRAHSAASTWDELHLFHADSPISRNWTAHQGNPVISDVTCARPAGRFFTQHGRLYRPSQNSSRRYGYAIHINEVIELSEHRYVEKAVETIEPTWNRSIRGVHSYSRAGRITTIDAMFRDRA